MSAEQSGGRPAPAPVQARLAVRLQLQYADSDAFVRGYAGNLSAAGLFVPADDPPAVGETLLFTVVLADERCVLRGEGQVVWTTGADAGSATAARPAGSAPADPAPPLRGFGLRFLRLDAASRQALAQALAYKAAQPAQFFTELPDPYAPSDPDAPRAPYLPYGDQTARPMPAAGPALSKAPAAPSGAAPRAPAESLALHAPAGPSAPAEEEAELRALLQPAPLAPAPAAADAARLLDALLSRRPVG